MPVRPPHICPGCRTAIPPGPCPTCHPPWQGARNPRAEPGFNTRRWRKTRATQLREHPFCQWPDCHHLGDVADHITPVAAGGAIYDPANVQTLCTEHHDRKTEHDLDLLRHLARARRMNDSTES